MSNLKQPILNKLILLITFIAFANVIIHGITVISSPNDTGLLKWIPDDTFYYILLAQNFLELGIWSADGGQTITTGFHLLWAYMLLPVVYLAGDNNLLLMKLAVGLSFILAMIVPIMTAIYLIKKNLSTHLLLLSVFISSFSFIVNSVSAMEWSIAFLISAIYFILIYYAIENTRKSLILLLLLGGVTGSLARLEFGAFTFAFFLSAILIYLFTKEKKYILPSLFGLIGATIGLIIVLSHNFYYSGEWLQNSSVVKAYWSNSVGHSPVRIIFHSIRTIFFIPNSMTLNLKSYPNIVKYLSYVFYVGILGLFYISIKYRHIKILNKFTTNNLQILFLSSSVFIVIFYIVIYSFAFSAFSWYTSLLTVPIFIIASFIISSKIINNYLTFSLLTIIIISNISIFHIKNDNEKVSYNISLLDSNKIIKSENNFGQFLSSLLKSHFENDKIGISDSGTINFYHKNIINLDGLVNNEIKNYLYSNQLECYLLDKKIKYNNGFGMSEFVQNLTNPIEWFKFSTPKIVIDELYFSNIKFVFHEIDFEKLAKLPKCANRTAAEIFVK